MKRSTVASVLSIFLLIPATLYLGTKLPGRWYYLTSTLMIIETMIPFFLAFEKRRPQRACDHRGYGSHCGCIPRRLCLSAVF